MLHEVTSSGYESLLAIRGDDPGVRMTYLEGELELMSSSFQHERIKKCISRLLEAYALEKGIELDGLGSWTVKAALRQRGIEPDECYLIQNPGQKSPEHPDLAIEVVWTSGGIDKLDVYRGLGVPEVWFWREKRLEVYVLDAGQYASSERSRLLPDLDLDLLVRHLDPEHQTRATRDYLAALRGR